MAHLRSQDKVVINLIFQMDAYSQGHLIDILPTTSHITAYPERQVQSRCAHVYVPACASTQLLSRVRLIATPWTARLLCPCDFSGNHWSGLPFPPLRDPPHPWI